MRTKRTATTPAVIQGQEAPVQRTCQSKWPLSHRPMKRAHSHGGGSTERTEAHANYWVSTTISASRRRLARWAQSRLLGRHPQRRSCQQGRSLQSFLGRRTLLGRRTPQGRRTLLGPAPCCCPSSGLLRSVHLASGAPLAARRRGPTGRRRAESLRAPARVRSPRPKWPRPPRPLEAGPAPPVDGSGWALFGGSD
jgi:hypothetical protein